MTSVRSKLKQMVEQSGTPVGRALDLAVQTLMVAPSVGSVRTRSHSEQIERFWQISSCTLRILKNADPFGTFCVNFFYANRVLEPDEVVTPSRWVYAIERYEG